MSDEPQGIRNRISDIRLLPSAITLMLFITVLLGLNYTADTRAGQSVIQASSSVETVTAPESENAVDDKKKTPPLEGIGFRPNLSAELIEDQYQLDHVRCEECPYGHYGASKEIGPRSPTYIGYHKDTEIRVRATFDDQFAEIKHLVVVPPADGISAADLEISDDD